MSKDDPQSDLWRERGGERESTEHRRWIQDQSRGIFKFIHFQYLDEGTDLEKKRLKRNQLNSEC